MRRKRRALSAAGIDTVTEGRRRMRATGIVRRIDELGRVVIPKEIRRTLRIREGAPLEIYTDNDGEVVLKKYSPIGEISAVAQDYSDSLYRTLGLITLVCDRDQIVSCAGVSRKEMVEKPLSPEVEQILEERKSAMYNAASGERMIPVHAEDAPNQYTAQLVVPILSDGEIIGGILLLSKDNGAQMTDVEQKVAETTAQIIGRQMEQ